ncbi:MAG: hypothetical protein ACREFR_14415 [Limisphaerales bacterium]
MDQPSSMNVIVRRLLKGGCLSFFMLYAVAGRVSAQPADNETVAATNSTPGQIAALQLQLTNAWHHVEAIVNQPVTAYRLDPGYRISISRPGWFHPGATTPDFNHVDVRKSQQLIYTAPWVSSDITPTMMFRGSDLEFNAMTKLFYTNRDLPKKRLTETEMLQINSLYRTIGRCQSEIERLENPDGAEPASADTESETNDAPPPPTIAAIERIPKRTRFVYGGIVIGTLLVLVGALRLLGKKPE